MEIKIFSCSLCFLLIFQSTLTLFISQIYIHISSWENSVFIESNILPVGVGRSKFECGVKCVQTIGCFSFFYNSFSAECRLVQGKLPDSVLAISEQGWNYYLHKGLLDNETYGVPFCSSVPQVSLCVTDIQGRVNNSAAEKACKDNGHPGFVLVDSEEKNLFIYYVTSVFEKENRYWIQGIRTGTCDTCFEDDFGRPLTYFKWDSPAYGGTGVQPRPRDRVAFLSAIGFWNAVKHQGWAGILCEV